MCELLNSYTNSMKKINKPWMQPLTHACVSISPPETPNELCACIKSFAPIQGWIQTLDNILLIQDDFKEINGAVQTAELVNKDGESLHIRPVNNQATVFIYTEGQEGDKYLSATYQHYIQHESIDNGTYQSLYRVYWDINTQNDPRQPIKYSRFIGFQTNNQEKK